MSNDLAKFKQSLPAHLQAEFMDTASNEALGELQPSDLGVPFLKMVHGTSAEAKPNWGGNQEAPMPQGTMFLSDTHEIVPVGTPFIVLCRRVSYIKWIGKPGDAKMAYSTLDKNDSRIVKENGLTFRKDPTDPTGTKNLPPLVTTYYNFYVITPQCMSQPHVLSFYRTAMPIGRELTRDIFQATQGNHLKPYTLKFILGTPFWETVGTNSWPQFTYQKGGFASPEIMARAKELYPLAQMMASAGAVEAEAKEIEEPGADANIGTMETDELPPQLKQAQGTIVPQQQQHTNVAQPAAPAVSVPQQQTAMQPATAAAPLW